MRNLLWMGLLSCVLVGCGGGSSSNGDLSSHDLSSHDLARVDQGGDDLSSQAPPDFAGVDLLGRVCFTSGACAQSNCGSACCGAGEWCDNGTCRCGQGNACTNGNMCQGLPTAGGDGCGSICCGHGVACPG